MKLPVVWSLDYAVYPSLSTVTAVPFPRVTGITSSLLTNVPSLIMMGVKIRKDTTKVLMFEAPEAAAQKDVCGSLPEMFYIKSLAFECLVLGLSMFVNDNEVWSCWRSMSLRAGFGVLKDSQQF